MSRWANKYVIGLTGNIAVGKSVVRQMLQHLGAYTIDADGLTHRAMATGAPAYKPIVETFGQFILDAEKNIDRNLLGSIVFARPDALAKLEAIVHPIVGQAIATLVSRAPQPVVVIEAIKLLEGDLAQAVDEVWVVDAAPETQLKRLVVQRKLGEAEARQRIAAQGAQAAKLAKANVVIKNDGNVEDTWKQVQVAWSSVQAKLAPARPAPAVA
ncbi:MAG: dephospho-CoA kinase, partial [Chloroflexi bacterium]|nr:dephospho-CoA kinase [Chloroflexota bacterium]